MGRRIDAEPLVLLCFTVFCHQFFRTGYVPDSPAIDVEHGSKGGDDQALGCQFRNGGRTVETVAIVNDVPESFVAENHQTGSVGHSFELVKIFEAENLTDRVLRVVDNDHLGLGRYRLFYLVPIDPVIRIPQVDVDRTSPRHLNQLGIGFLDRFK